MNLDKRDKTYLGKRHESSNNTNKPHDESAISIDGYARLFPETYVLVTKEITSDTRLCHVCCEPRRLDSRDEQGRLFIHRQAKCRLS
jgi:hypothetical protein